MGPYLIFDILDHPLSEVMDGRGVVKLGIPHIETVG